MSLATKPAWDARQLRDAQRSVLRRLARLRRLVRLHLVVEGLFWVITAAGTAALASLALDRLLRFEPPTRFGLLAIGLAAILYVAYRKLFEPLRVPLANLDLAELLDRRSPGVGQQIANVLELPQLLEAGQFASPSLVRAAVAECQQALDRRDLVATLNLARRRKLLAGCGVWLALLVGFCWLWPGVAELWARRWLAGSSLRWPQHTYLNVVGLDSDGRLLVPRGELALVQIDAQPAFVQEAPGRWQLGGRGEPLLVESFAAPASAPPEQVSLDYRLADGSRRSGNAEQFDAGHFRYELPPLAEPAEMHVTGGDDWLGPITIEPVDRPGIESLEITAVPPGSSQPVTERVGEGTAQLLYLPQTELTVTLVADQPLEAAEALDRGANVAGWQRVDERTYTAAWTMREALALEFRLRGVRGGLISKPYFLAIGLLKDREPRVAIRSTGVGRRVTPVARIPLSVRATDDFELASLALDWELTSLREAKPHVETKELELETFAREPSAEPLLQFVYDNELALAETGLAPGNALKLRGVAVDACALGAQTGHSRWMSFQIVSSDELFYEILMRQREQRARFAAAFDSAKNQLAAIDELAQVDDVPGLARAQQVINRQVWQVANQLEATLLEMTLNDLGNQQARDNLQSAIITPIEKLHEDLLGRLRGSIDALPAGGAISPDRRAEAQALAQQSVDVMQSILAQMSLWESFIDVINQLRHVIEAQTGVLKATEEVQKQRTDQLFE